MFTIAANGINTSASGRFSRHFEKVSHDFRALALRRGEKGGAGGEKGGEKGGAGGEKGGAPAELLPDAAAAF